jgi:MoxR-like ATPase
MAESAVARAKSPAPSIHIPELEPAFDDIESVKHACDKFREVFAKLKSEVGKVIVGQDEVVEQTLIALFADGHVLLEGVPGLGKTLLVRTLGRALTLPFSRIQFTPDLMPADITGTSIVVEDERTGHREFSFRPGPIFKQLVLADEINRATPKSQSALLEAMQEKSVTVGGKTFKLDRPFFVMATQNPIEQEGTYPLPEAQLDRFIFKITVPYTTQHEMNRIIGRTTVPGSVEALVSPALDARHITMAQPRAIRLLLADLAIARLGVITSTKALVVVLTSLPIMAAVPVTVAVLVKSSVTLAKAHK